MLAASVRTTGVPKEPTPQHMFCVAVTGDYKGTGPCIAFFNNDLIANTPACRIEVYTLLLCKLLSGDTW